MHWAAYKGFFWIVWYLLHAGVSPLDIDMYGNTSVHQAATAGHKNIIECFLSQGADVDLKNARGHTPLDLATDPEVKDLIKYALKTKNCTYC